MQQLKTALAQQQRQTDALNAVLKQRSAHRGGAWAASGDQQSVRTCFEDKVEGRFRRAPEMFKATGSDYLADARLACLGT